MRATRALLNFLLFILYKDRVNISITQFR